jgi:hypothetical protein
MTDTYFLKYTGIQLGTFKTRVGGTGFRFSFCLLDPPFLNRQTFLFRYPDALRKISLLRNSGRATTLRTKGSTLTIILDFEL